MKDINQVLSQKLAELDNTRRDVYALRRSAPLLAEEEDVKQAMNQAVAEEAAEQKKGVEFL